MSYDDEYDESDEVEEGEEEVVYEWPASPELLSNEGSWSDGVWQITRTDVAICLTGLAANISTSFAVFWRDLRSDLCASRNHREKIETVKSFDRELMQLSAADLEA
jgi:hypothetical protein